MTADEFAKMNEDDLKMRMSEFLDREVKVTITAKKETYNNMERVKYSVNKAIVDIDYLHESAVIAKQIELLKQSLQ